MKWLPMCRNVEQGWGGGKERELHACLDVRVRVRAFLRQKKIKLIVMQ